MRLTFTFVLSICALVGCASQGTQNVKSQLAPTGTLRVGLNLGNTILTAKSSSTGGDPTGVAVDIARELGRRVGVPVQFLSYESPGALGGSIQAQTWDVAFFAIEPTRAGQVDFSPGYADIETTYMVRIDSSLRSASEVDREGIVVATTRGAGYTPILAGMLKHAQLLQTIGVGVNLNLLKEKKADAITGLRPMLAADTEKLPGFRVLDGNFVVVQQAIGVQKGRSEASAYVSEFVQDIKRSGFLAKVIVDNNVRGLTISK